MNNIREIAAKAVATWDKTTVMHRFPFLCHHLRNVHEGMKPSVWNVFGLWQWLKRGQYLRLWLKELRRQMASASTMESYIYDYVYSSTPSGKVKVKLPAENFLREEANKLRLNILLDAMNGKPLQLEACMLELMKEHQDESPPNP